jgi:phage portal protein BeeE
VANLFRWLAGDQPERSVQTLPLGLDQWTDFFTFNHNTYPFVVNNGNTPQNAEEPGGSFNGFVEGVYKRNGVVFACMAARQLLFSEARFQYQQMRAGRPGDLFGTPALAPLETPWVNGTTGDLLERAIVDVDLAGNFYAVRRGDQIRRLRPDWVTIIAGSRTGSAIDAEVVGYEYQDGGPAGGQKPELLLPEFVAHFKAYDDPTARFRGISWLGPVIGDIVGDGAATTHKTNFFGNGANLGYVVTLDPDGKFNPKQFNEWVSTFKAGHEGIENAYKTLFLSGGADVKVVGTDLKQLDFKAIQGAGETRICAAARVPAIIVGVSEGLESATYSNYGQARRAFADLTMRPMWRKIAGALQSIVEIPPGSRLWYDDRDIPFLQEDQQDAAAITQTQAATITMYVREGFTADSAVAAVVNNDPTMLVHTGMVSVQLHPPGENPPSSQSPPQIDPAPAGQNGAGRDLRKELEPLLLPRGS